MIREATRQGLRLHEYKSFVAECLKVESLISSAAQNKPYLYHAVLESPENVAVSCTPDSMAYNSRTIYRCIAAIWPNTFADIIRKYNVIRKERRKSTVNNQHTNIANSEPIA